jgi:hypothetical protein
MFHKLDAPGVQKRRYDHLLAVITGAVSVGCAVAGFACWAGYGWSTSYAIINRTHDFTVSAYFSVAQFVFSLLAIGIALLDLLVLSFSWTNRTGRQRSQRAVRIGWLGLWLGALSLLLTNILI